MLNAFSMPESMTSPGRRPLEQAPLLSQRVGNQVWLKREDLQPVFSFKCRGAFNKLVNLSHEAKSQGVWLLRLRAIMRRASRWVRKSSASRPPLSCRSLPPSIKVDAVRSRGATVILVGDTFDEAASKSTAAGRRQRILTFIHPFDDPDVIAGQGTVAMEITRQASGTFRLCFYLLRGRWAIGGYGGVPTLCLANHENISGWSLKMPRAQKRL